MMTLDPIAAAVLRFGLSALLLSSAWHKLRDASTFRTAVAEYRLLPEIFVTLVAVLIMAAELTFGFGLLVAQTSARAAVGSAALLAMYTTAIGINLARGRTRIDCGCSGPAGALPLHPALVVRNLALVVLSVCAALPVAPRQLELSDWLVVVGATSAFAFLYAAADTALANALKLLPLNKGGWEGFVKLLIDKSPSVPLFQRGK